MPAGGPLSEVVLDQPINLLAVSLGPGDGPRLFAVIRVAGEGYLSHAPDDHGSRLRLLTDVEAFVE